VENENSGQSPEARQDLPVQPGVTSETSTVPEQTDERPAAAPPAVDERGVPLTNVVAELQRKLAKEQEWTERYQRQAEESAAQAALINQRFQEFTARQNASQPALTPSAVNPALYPGTTQVPTSPPPGTAPLPPQGAYRDPRVDDLLFQQEVSSVERDFPEAGQVGSEFNRELLWEVSQAKTQNGGVIPPGTIRDKAEAIYGRLVRSGAINPTAPRPTMNQPVAPTVPGTSTVPADTDSSRNSKIPAGILQDLERLGLDPKEYIEDIKKNPSKYRGTMEAFDTLGGNLGR